MTVSVDGLSLALDRFMEGRSFNADDVCCQCWDISKELIDFLIAEGFPASAVFLHHYQGDPLTRIHSLWEDSNSLSHNTVMVNEMSYDFTYRQFDSQGNVPHIQSLEDLAKNWKVVKVSDHKEEK